MEESLDLKAEGREDHPILRAAGRGKIRGEAAVSLALPCREMGGLRDVSPLLPGRHPVSDLSPPGNHLGVRQRALESART